MIFSRVACEATSFRVSGGLWAIHGQGAMQASPITFPELQRAFDHHRAGRFEEAEAGYRLVLVRLPHYPAALHGLGLINFQASRFEEAVALLRRAVAVMPKLAEYRCNLAAVLGEVGRHDEAIIELREAVAIKPDYAEAWCNLGVALERRDAAREAVDAYCRSIELKPDYAQAHNFHGNALRRLGRLREAEEAHRKALALDESLPGAWASLASTLSGQGRLREVIVARRKVCELHPKSASAASALLATMHYDPIYTPKDLLAEARAWAEHHGGAGRFASKPKSHGNDRDPGRRLRVGFLSGNLTAHPEGRLLRPVLANLDPEQFETFVYSSTGRGDGVTFTLRQICDTWRDVDSMRDKDVALGIAEDQIDILIDLGGHFGNNRMQLLARKPAPVQIVHFGYPGTSGLDQVDWRLTDGFADPPRQTQPDGRAAYTTERLLHLPDLAWCYESPLEARAIGSLPALRRGHITFCCCNNTMKLTEPAVAVWSRILLALPTARLEVLADGGRRPEADQPDERACHILDLFAQAGVERERVVLIARQPRHKYFEWIQSCDIALDPFPYNGGVTSCDTLWMGVPFVTLGGDSYWSRQGAALLSNLGLQHLIGASEDQYVKAAVELATDTRQLSQLRRGLRERMARSPITDSVGFAAKLAEALRSAWTQWCGERAAQAKAGTEPVLTMA